MHEWSKEANRIDSKVDDANNVTSFLEFHLE